MRDATTQGVARRMLLRRDPRTSGRGRRALFRSAQASGSTISLRRREFSRTSQSELLASAGLLRREGARDAVVPGWEAISYRGELRLDSGRNAELGGCAVN